jgi:thymidylate synthase ThyX
MSIEAKIIEDSVNEKGERLTTFVLRYPRYIHSEVLTHRVFSRNASSSRAIPVTKIIDSVENDLVIPIHWGQNQRGMQAEKEVVSEAQKKAIKIWKRLAKQAVKGARELAELGIHKQVTNRVLEPYSHISVVLTSTDFANFFYLRYNSDAQPEIKELAKQMYKLYIENQPRQVKSFFGEDTTTEVEDSVVTKNAHLPFVLPEERELPFKQAAYISQARCARVSYNNHDGTSNDIKKDEDLAKILANSGHFSPFEHQAISIIHALNKYKGNFNHNFDWVQIRKLYPDEYKTNLAEFKEESDGE